MYLTDWHLCIFSSVCWSEWTHERCNKQFTFFLFVFQLISQLSDTLVLALIDNEGNETKKHRNSTQFDSPSWITEAGSTRFWCTGKVKILNQSSPDFQLRKNFTYVFKHAATDLEGFVLNSHCGWQNHCFTRLQFWTNCTKKKIQKTPQGTLEGSITHFVTILSLISMQHEGSPFPWMQRSWTPTHCTFLLQTVSCPSMQVTHCRPFVFCISGSETEQETCTRHKVYWETENCLLERWWQTSAGIGISNSEQYKFYIWLPVSLGQHLSKFACFQ